MMEKPESRGRQANPVLGHIYTWFSTFEKNVLKRWSINPTSSDAQPKDEIGPSFFAEKRAKGAMSWAVTMTF
jgi:hypothetical protein